MGFKKATKAGSWLRLALTGPSGSGKSFTGLAIGSALVPNGRVAAIDTEHGSLSLYSDRFAFDVMELEEFEPQSYINAIREAVDGGYQVLLIDSLSHAWMGVGGILDQLDNAKRNFNAWKNLTPQQNALVDAIIRSDIHVIATMRSKQEYVVEKDSNGKSVPRKLGMAAIQRDGFEYEFTAVIDMDMDHVGTASKTRCPGLDGKAFRKPGADVAKILREWLGGEPPKASAERPRRAEAREEPEEQRESVTVTDSDPPRGNAVDAVDAADDFEPVRTDRDGFPDALAQFCTELDAAETAEECLAAFQRHRAQLRELDGKWQSVTWDTLVATTNSVGKMKNAGVWINRALEEDDRRRKAEAETPKESTADMARKAFAACRDARSLLQHAVNVLRLKGAERDEVALAYRDRWVEMTAALDGDARKRVVRAIGGFPAEIWELCDWQPFRRLLGVDGGADEASGKADQEHQADVEHHFENGAESPSLGGDY